MKDYCQLINFSTISIICLGLGLILFFPQYAQAATQIYLSPIDPLVSVESFINVYVQVYNESGTVSNYGYNYDSFCFTEIEPPVWAELPTGNGYHMLKSARLQVKDFDTASYRCNFMGSGISFGEVNYTYSYSYPDINPVAKISPSFLSSITLTKDGPNICVSPPEAASYINGLINPMGANCYSFGSSLSVRYDQASYDPDGDIANATLKCSNGDTSSIFPISCPAPMGTGTYTHTLTVTDNEGYTNSTNASVGWDDGGGGGGGGGDGNYNITLSGPTTVTAGSKQVYHIFIDVPSGLSSSQGIREPKVLMDISYTDSYASCVKPCPWESGITLPEDQCTWPDDSVGGWQSACLDDDDYCFSADWPFVPEGTRMACFRHEVPVYQDTDLMVDITFHSAAGGKIKSLQATLSSFGADPPATFPIISNVLDVAIVNLPPIASGVYWSFTTKVTQPPIAGASAGGKCDNSPIYPPGTSVDLATNAAGCASSDPDGTIKKFEWDWTSDSVYDYSCCSFGCSALIVDSACNINRIYNSAAVTKLRVTDDDGATATDTVNINICSIACEQDSQCNDNDSLTKDTCKIMPNPCDNYCVYTPIISIKFWREILPKF